MLGNVPPAGSCVRHLTKWVLISFVATADVKAFVSGDSLLSNDEPQVDPSILQKVLPALKDSFMNPASLRGHPGVLADPIGTPDLKENETFYKLRNVLNDDLCLCASKTGSGPESLMMVDCTILNETNVGHSVIETLTDDKLPTKKSALPSPSVSARDGVSARHTTSNQPEGILEHGPLRPSDSGSSTILPARGSLLRTAQKTPNVSAPGLARIKSTSRIGEGFLYIVDGYHLRVSLSPSTSTVAGGEGSLTRLYSSDDIDPLIETSTVLAGITCDASSGFLYFNAKDDGVMRASVYGPPSVPQLLGSTVKRVKNTLGVAVDTENNRLFFGGNSGGSHDYGSGVWVTNLEGTENATQLSTHNALDIVYIPAAAVGGTDQVIWADNKYIRSIVPDGTSEPSLLFTNSYHNMRIAVDPPGRRIFWNEFQKGEIFVASVDNVDSSGKLIPEVMISETTAGSSLYYPFNMAYDATENMLYWQSWLSGGEIYRAIAEIGEKGEMWHNSRQFNNYMTLCNPKAPEPTPEPTPEPVDPSFGWWFLDPSGRIWNKGRDHDGNIYRCLAKGEDNRLNLLSCSFNAHQNQTRIKWTMTEQLGGLQTIQNNEADTFLSTYEFDSDSCECSGDSFCEPALLAEEDPGDQCSLAQQWEQVE